MHLKVGAQIFGGIHYLHVNVISWYFSPVTLVELVELGDWRVGHELPLVGIVKNAPVFLLSQSVFGSLYQYLWCVEIFADLHSHQRTGVDAGQ